MCAAMEQQKPRITLDKPANYRIVFQGYLDESWSDYVGGMTISAEEDENQNYMTILTGQVRDQAMLVGVLTTVYNLSHLPLLSVECISVDSRE